MEVIYLDVLMALNAAVDLVLLTLTAQLAGVPVQRVRLALGALTGALYAALTVFPVPPLLSWMPVRFAVGFGMVALTFGRYAPLGRLYAVFLAVSCALAGITVALYLATGVSLGKGGVYYFNVPLRAVLAAAAIAYVATGVLFRGSAKHGTVRRTTEEVTLTAFGRTTRCTLLLDSGCDLTDPVSGRPVLVLERGAAARLLPPEVRFVCTALSGQSAASVFPKLPASYCALFRLLPFQAVGTSGGLLLMFRLERAVRGDGTRFDGYAAISPQKIAGGRYEGLIGL
ncbi:MAG: hypothetical protein EOM63_03840 [Clostridia bacterium]|nr:hypothetical protein [Clostridia bacterium]